MKPSTVVTASSLLHPCRTLSLDFSFLDALEAEDKEAEQAAALLDRDPWPCSVDAPTRFYGQTIQASRTEQVTAVVTRRRTARAA